MRLSRFFIGGLFLFFFAFGIQSQVFAQVPPNCTPQPGPIAGGVTYSQCVNGGAGYFYGHLAACQQLTCSAAYTPGAFPKLPPTITDMMKATYQQVTTGRQSSQAFAGAPDICIDGRCDKGSPSVASSIVSYLVISLGGGKTPVTTLNAQGVSETHMVSSTGVTDATINYMAKLYTKPASTGEYMEYVAQSIQNPFGAQPAYAQGLGFSSLSPVLELWKLFRNVAYFFFVIIFLIIGFLIMFRSKIGGQAAVTVQQALPKIIVALLLVTFSYAIAGLLIDIMYLVMYLIIGIFTGLFPGGQIDAGGGLQSLTDIAFRNDIFTNGIRLTSLSSTIAESMGRIVANILTNLGWNTVVAGVVTFAASIVFMLILIVAILVSLFRVFFALLQAYLGIFFSVIFAPIQLLIGALPGQNTFGSWISGLLENLLVFPVLVLMIFIAYFIARGGQPAAASGGFSAPQLGSNQGGGFAYYQDLIALGAILAMPEVLKVTKGIMKGKIDVTPKQLVDNLFAGNQYAAPVLFGAGGAAYGAARGAYAGYQQLGGFRGALEGAFKGVEYKDAKTGETRYYGGVNKRGPQAYGWGSKIAETIDRAREGKLLDPNTLNRQIEALRKQGEEKKSPGGSSGTGGGPMPTP